MTKHTIFLQNPITAQNTIKQIRASIETHLSNSFSNKMLFKESTIHYEDNLRQSGYNKKVTYKPIDTNHQYNIVSIREKPYSLTHRLTIFFLQKLGNIF